MLIVVMSDIHRAGDPPRDPKVTPKKADFRSSISRQPEVGGASSLVGPRRPGPSTAVPKMVGVACQGPPAKNFEIFFFEPLPRKFLK